MTYESIADQVGLNWMIKELYISFMEIRWPEIDPPQALNLAECFLYGLENEIPDRESKRVLAMLQSSYQKGMAEF